MRLGFSRIAILLTCLTPLLLFGQEEYPLGRESGKLIIDRLINEQNIQTEVADIVLAVIDSSGNVNQRELLVAASRAERGHFNYLIRFTAPSDIAGTGLISREQDSGDIEQFLYLPALGQITPITGDSKQSSFMGSDFTYEDLQRESTQHYEYAYVGDTRIGNRMVYKVVALASTPGRKKITGYARRILFIDKLNLNVLKVEFYDKNNVHQKTLEAFDYSVQESNLTTRRPQRAVMENHIKRTTSILTLRQGRTNVPISKELFVPDSLQIWTQENEAQIRDLLSFTPDNS